MLTDRNVKILLIACLIIGTLLLHYGTPGRLMYVHVLFQALFFLPVTLAGLWFGKKGGLLAVAAICVVYVYHAVTMMMPTKEMAVSNGLQILLMLVAGFFTGTYSDLRRGYQATVQGLKPAPAATFPTVQRLLVYLDDSGSGMNAIRYVASTFGQVPAVKVTLFSVSGNPKAELFKSQKEHEEAQAKAADSSRAIMAEARKTLVQGGFPDDHIENRLVECQNARVSDLILEEQRTGNYSAIVAGRLRLSRAEEFLFGNVAVRLARQAGCPVWVIGENPPSPL